MFGKSFARAVLLAVSGLVFTNAAYAADVFGVWLTETNDEGKSMAVEIFACGDKICGKAVDIFGSDNRENIGKEIIKGMQKKSETSFAKGKIYAPDTKKWYRSKMTLNADDSLKVAGCVLGGLICRSQVWTRQP